MKDFARWDNASMKGKYTILAPQMSEIHFGLLESVIRGAGHDFKVIKEITAEDIKFGRDHVDSGMCYPTIITTGSLINTAINLKNESGQPVKNVAIIMTQTGGSCRASQYVYTLRRVLRKLGREDIIVIPLAFAPFGKEPWNPLGFKLHDVKNAMCALLLGDLLMSLLHKTRPYEQAAGASQAIVDQTLEQFRVSGFKKMNDARFSSAVEDILAKFDQVKVSKQAKPKIGIVGEIYLKFNASANNHLVRRIEDAGGEAVVTPLVDFFLYCFAGQVFQHELLGRSWLNSQVMKILINFVERRKTMVSRCMANHECSQQIHWPDIFTLSKKVDDPLHPEKRIISRANNAGEGWLLPAEIVDLIEQGCNGVVITQPFGCLANHAIGRGTEKKIRELFPYVQITCLDYDPNVSSANQDNRLELLFQFVKQLISIFTQRENINN